MIKDKDGKTKYLFYKMKLQL